MDKNVQRIASYLKSLSHNEYGISSSISAVTNYVIDSYFAKIDEIKLRNSKDMEWVPPNLDSHVKEEWLGCEIHKVITINRSYPAFAVALNAWAFVNLLRPYAGDSASYELVPYIDIYKYKEYLKHDYRYRVQYGQMDIKPNTSVTLPVFGTFFLIDRQSGKHIIVLIDLCYESLGCSFSVIASEEDQTLAEKFIDNLQVSMKENDIYYKKCLSFNKGSVGFHEIIDTDWSNVVLKDQLKDEIRTNSVGILDNMDSLASIGMCPNRNIILISQPGMAKTTMFRATSNELQDRCTRIWCTGKSIQYAEHVTSLFEAARTLTPCIIFIEDMDLFGGDRGSMTGNSTLLNEFLAQLDGTKANAGIVVMASTNDIASMDEALVNRPGRFSVKIEVPLPDGDDRRTMLLKFLKEFSARPDADISIDSWDTIINLMDGFTGDYIKEVAKQIVIRATKEGRNDGNQVIFNVDDLSVSGAQVMKNFKIGQKAKKHIDVTIDNG